MLNLGCQAELLNWIILESWAGFDSLFLQGGQKMPQASQVT